MPSDSKQSSKMIESYSSLPEELRAIIMDNMMAEKRARAPKSAGSLTVELDWKTEQLHVKATSSKFGECSASLPLCSKRNGPIVLEMDCKSKKLCVRPAQKG